MSAQTVIIAKLTPSSTESVEPSGETYTGPLLLGDADLDGKITPHDSSIVLIYYSSAQLGLTPTFSDDAKLNTRIINEVADVDGDGAVDANDAYYILCYYATYQLMGAASWEEILAL